MRRPEQQIQKAVFDHIRARGVPGLFAFHVPNGGWRRPVEAAIFKGLGVVAGVPDVILMYDGSTFALELKAPGRKRTAAQEDVASRMFQAGVIVEFASSLDEAIRTLERWGLLRGKAAPA